MEMMSSKSIRIRCVGADAIPYTTLEDFQDDLVSSTQDEIDILKRNIVKWGFDHPAAVWEHEGKYFTIDGNRRRIALRQLEQEGFTVPLIPIVLVEADTEKEAKQRVLHYRSSYGHITQEAFDRYLRKYGLEVKMDELKVDGVNIGVELDMEEEEEEAYEPPMPSEEQKIPRIVNIGDIVDCGVHQFVCGDSAFEETYKALLGSTKVDMVFTSPPYNQGGASLVRYKKKRNQPLYSSHDDAMGNEDYKDFLKTVLKQISRIVERDAPVFWNVSYNANARNAYGYIVFDPEGPFQVRETIVWDKLSAYPICADRVLSRVSEFIFLLCLVEEYKTNQSREGESVYWNTWRISSVDSQVQGKIEACFPVALPSYAIEKFSPPEAIVLDPFLGSGSTMIACAENDRICRGIEKSPETCDVVLWRWAHYMQDCGLPTDISVNGVELDTKIIESLLSTE